MCVMCSQMQNVNATPLTAPRVFLSTSVLSAIWFWSAFFWSFFFFTRRSDYPAGLLSQRVWPGRRSAASRRKASGSGGRRRARICICCVVEPVKYGFKSGCVLLLLLLLLTFLFPPHSISLSFNSPLKSAFSINLWWVFSPRGGPRSALMAVLSAVGWPCRPLLSR